MSADATSRGEGVHATAVVYAEHGVVVTGPSGSGKSALALALLARARATGRFGALIGDDRVWISAVAGRLLAFGAPHTAGLIERRAAGVQRAPSEPAVVVSLIVELSGSDRIWPRWPAEPEEIVLAGLAMPRLTLDSRLGAADQAVSVVDRLESIAVDRGVMRGISLEQSAAVHKNKKLATSWTAITTSEA